MTGERSALSVAVVALDEERNIARCLRSVAWAEERLVVDTGSRDRTVEIAVREGARVVRASWRGFGATKNLAIEHTRHPWVLSLDADEWLTPAGAAEMQTVLTDPRRDAYSIRRRPALCGRFVDHAWAPDEHLRLFRREVARFDDRPVHESLRLAPGASRGRLTVPVPHLTYRNLSDWVRRMDRYSSLAAQEAHARGRPASLARWMVSPPTAFVRSYVWKRGFLDGRRGWIVAVGAAFASFLKHAKRWERRRDASEELSAVAGSTPEDPDPAARDDGQSG